MQRNTLFRPKMGVKMPNCTCNVRKTPKTHMKPYISRPVSIYGIRWNIYHMLFVKIWNSIATKYPFSAQNGGKMPNCTGNVRKTPKTHMKPYISRPVSIYGIRWNIYHDVVSKDLKLYCNEIPFLCPKWGSKCLIAPVMSENHLKHIWNLILAGLYQFMEVRWNIYHMLLVKIWNSIATKYTFSTQNVCQNAYLHL